MIYTRTQEATSALVLEQACFKNGFTSDGICLVTSQAEFFCYNGPNPMQSWAEDAVEKLAF